MGKKDSSTKGKHAAPAEPEDTTKKAKHAPKAAKETSKAPKEKKGEGAEPDLKFSDDAYPAAEGVVPVAALSDKPKKKHGKVVAIVFGVIFGILAIAYLAGVVVFSGRFFPSTVAGKMDLSLLTVEEVEQRVEQASSEYELSVRGQGFQLDLTSEEAGMSVDGAAVAARMHEDVNAWAWPYEVFQSHDETGQLAASYNESGLEEAVRAAVDEFNADKTPPVNATIAFDPDLNQFAVVEEQLGTALDADAVIKVVDDAVVSLTESVQLTKDELQQPTVLSTEPALQEAADQANTMITADLTLTLAGDVAAKVDAAQISQWVVLDEELSATLSQDALTAWVDQLTADCNTVGTTRTYTRADGKQITVSGGVYGWEVDRDALLAQVKDAVAAGTVGEQEVPVLSSGSAYNGPGGRDWGNRYIDIDLAEQHVRFYDDSGALVWESDCISGTPDGEHDTSVGVYWINGMESPSMLIGYENGKKIYETQVSYWMPFDGNSIGLHDANWQPAFGGSMYAEGYGSHGCVNLPVDKAAELYSMIQPGDCVVSHW